MSRQYKGLKIPDGLNKDSAREMDLTEDCAAVFYEGVSRPFCPGVRCRDCICVREHRKELKELLKMWNEEDNPIKPGMVVKFDISQWCLVLRVYSDYVEGWEIGVSVGDYRHYCVFGDGIRVQIEDIKEIYKSTRSFGIPVGAELQRLLSGEGLEQLPYIKEVDPPVLELTVKDIEEKYGRKVKIVGEQND